MHDSRIFMRIFFLLFVLLMSSPALAEPEFRVDRDTVFWEDPEANEKIWIFRHKGIQLDDANQPEHPIRGPIQADGRWYYSVAADVLEVDVEKGAIVGRTHYSLYVEDLKVSEDGQLEVVVDPDDPLDEDRRLTLAHTGESPGRGFWKDGALTAMRALRDANGYLKDKDWETSSEDRTSVVGLLQNAAERDRTNPFYAGYLGLFSHLDDEPEKSVAYFQQALETQAPWFDMVRLCGMMRRAEQDELAGKACDMALEKMRAENIRPEAMYGLITFATMMQDHREAMKNAVAANDYERADAIGEDMYRLYPRVEASHHAWRVLGKWLGEAGKKDLAAKWAKRGDEVENSTVTRAFWGGARKVDRMLLVLASAMLMLPLAGFFIGLRTSRRRPEVEGAKKWLPRPTLLEVVSVLLVLVAAIFSGHEAAKHITMIGEFASMPTPLLSEGYGSPESIRWIDGRVESPAREELLDFAQHELEMAKSGSKIEKELPAKDILIRVVDRHAGEVAWHDFFKSGSFKIFERASFGDSNTPPSPPVGLPILIVFVFFLLVGTAVSRVMPSASRWLGYFVPGGTRNAGWATPWILGAFFAGAFWAFTPLGSILQTIATPSFPKFFGLDGLVDVDFLVKSGLDGWLPWLLLFGSLAAHGVLVYLDRRKD